MLYPSVTFLQISPINEMENHKGQALIIIVSTSHLLRIRDNLLPRPIGLKIRIRIPITPHRTTSIHEHNKNSTVITTATIVVVIPT